jgi:CHAT domain-containing protein
MKRFSVAWGCCLGLALTPVAVQSQALAQSKPTVGATADAWLSQSFPDGQSDRIPQRRDRGSGLGLPDLFNIIRVRPRIPKPQSPRDRFEEQIKQSTPEEAIQRIEAWQAQQFSEYLGVPTPPLPISAAQISQRLGQISQRTGQQSGLMYVAALKDELQLFFIPPSRSPLVQREPTLIASTQPLLAQNTPPVVREVLGTDRKDILKAANTFRRAVRDPSQANTSSYLSSSQRLYEWIVAPLKPQLEAHGIQTLLFSMDDELRSLPLAALHDGQQFLIENHQVALLPSFQLTDSGSSDLRNQTILAMGISESTQGLSPLPAVPVELSALANYFWKGRSHATLNQDSTLANLQTYQRQNRYGIIHVASHAQFRSGAPHNSFIQFWDSKLNLTQLQGLSQSLRWQSSPSVDLLVLSACQTAVGSDEAELGFAGAALNAGVKATVASLWMVSDDGTLAVMSKFYEHLRSAPTKTEALRQAQIALLKGQVQIQGGQLQLSDQVQLALPPALTQQGDRTFTHPYFWSGYTVVGNWN